MARQTFESAAFEEQEPLDPTLMRVQARLRRLMLIAGLTLGLGILAVLGAMLYRINGLSTTAAKPFAAGAAVAVDLAGAGLPADARLVSSTLAGDRLALTYETAAGNEVLIVDVRSAVVVGRLVLKR